MFKLEEIPFWLWITFSVVYACIGDPDNSYWSGIYFSMNYIVLTWSFTVQKNKKIRDSGACMSVSFLIFCIIKFFIYPEIERFCIFILFLISLGINIYLLKRK